MPIGYNELKLENDDPEEEILPNTFDFDSI